MDNTEDTVKVYDIDAVTPDTDTGLVQPDCDCEPDCACKDTE